MDIAHAYSQYIKTLEFSGLSSQSRRMYISHARRFVEYIKESTVQKHTDRVDFHCPPGKDSGSNQLSDNIARELAESYSDQILQRYSKNSAVIVLSTLCRFWTFLDIETPNIERPTRVATPWTSLSAEEVQNLLQTLAQLNSPKTEALVLMFLEAGLKPGRVRALDIDNLSGNSSEIWVSAQTRDGASIKLPPAASAAVDKWLQARRHCLIDRQNPALFLNLNGSRISITGIDYLIKRLGQRCHMVLSARTLRQTYLDRLSKKVRQ